MSGQETSCVRPPEVRELFPDCYIDAEVSRYVGGGIEASQNFEARGLLGDVVVISLGSNGPIAGQERYDEQTMGLLECLGPKRHIFWVNIYGPELSWEQTNNDCIKKLAAERANVTEVDWHGLISQHPDWLTEDGIHPETEGCRAYAALIRDRIREVLAEERK